MRHSSPRLAGALLACATLIACADPAAAPITPPPLPPLGPITWYAHAAEGQPLPALVAHRLRENVLEQDFLDSARIEVQANGRWVRSLWLSRYRDGRFDRPVAQQELGAWAAGDTAYEFTSDADGRRFTVPVERPNGVLRLPLRSVRDGYIDATLRPVPLPASILGSYALINARGQTPPAAVEVFPDVELEGRRVSVHFLVDSARVQLLGNQRYEHRIWYSEWEGPPNGAPAVRRMAYYHTDFGTWTRDETLLRFESGWLQNHRVLGTTYGASTMELLHGLGPGEAAVPFRYQRE